MILPPNKGTTVCYTKSCSPERIAALLEYEASLQKKLDIRLKATCTYHKDDFATLSKQQQEILLSAHNRVLA